MYHNLLRLLQQLSLLLSCAPNMYCILVPVHTSAHVCVCDNMQEPLFSLLDVCVLK